MVSPWLWGKRHNGRNTAICLAKTHKTVWNFTVGQENSCILFMFQSHFLESVSYFHEVRQIVLREHAQICSESKKLLLRLHRFQLPGWRTWSLCYSGNPCWGRQVSSSLSKHLGIQAKSHRTKMSPLTCIPMNLIVSYELSQRMRTPVTQKKPFWINTIRLNHHWRFSWRSSNCRLIRGPLKAWFER